MPTSGPILWQLNQLWIGPTYPGGMYYYITFPGPDATQPSYQASKSLPPDMSGLPAGATSWNTLTLLAPWAATSTLKYRIVQNGTVLQLNGQLSVATPVAAGTATPVAVLPAPIAAALTLPANAVVMTNSGATGATANLEIQVTPAGNIVLTPTGQPLSSATIQQAYVLNSDPNQTILGTYGTLTAAQAACQNDVNPPIPIGLHSSIPPQ